MNMFSHSKYLLEIVRHAETENLRKDVPSDDNGKHEKFDDEDINFNVR